MNPLRSRSRSLLPALLALSLVLCPQHALANMGTLLTIATQVHLFIGNLLIGLLEGLLLAWLFQVKWFKAILVMIPANYASAWLGGVLLRGEILNAVPLNLNNAWTWFWILAGITYGLTLLIEWPFVGFTLRGTNRWLRRSILASLLVQSVSYILLFWWYWAASGASLYTQNRIAAPGELSLPDSVLVYYIDREDGHVHRRPLSGGVAEKVSELGSTNYWDRLLARPNASDSNRWDLLVELGRWSTDFVEVLTNQAVVAVADPPEEEIRSSWLLGHFAPAPALGSATNSPWHYQAGMYAIQGLRGEHAETGEQRGFAYETPFGEWRVSNAFLLPGGLVLFQLGADQICAYDPEDSRVTLLWRGYAPLPVIERQAPEPE